MNPDRWQAALRRLRGAPLRAGLEVQPFFVVGSGRSGNTLLRRFLTAHSELHIPPETYVFGRAIRVYRSLRRHAWRERVAAVYGLLEQHGEFHTFRLDCLRGLAAEVLAWPADAQGVDRLLDAFVRHHARVVAGKAPWRWGDKTPLNAFALDELEAAFPDARYIHVLRDGVDVAASYVNAGRYPDLRAAAQRWSRAVRRVLGFERAHPDRVLTVRYESLVMEPEREVRRACEFLGVEYVPGVLAANSDPEHLGDVAVHVHHVNVVKPVFTGSIGKGRRGLTRDQLRAVGRVIDPLLVRLGYARCE